MTQDSQRTHWKLVPELARRFDTNGSTAGDHNMVGFLIFVPPLLQPIIHLVLVVGKGDSTTPNRARRQHKNIVRQLPSVLQRQDATLRSIRSIDSYDLADPQRSVAIDEYFVVRYECGVFQVALVGRGDTGTGEHMDGIWSGIDEDQVIFGPVELSREAANDVVSCCATAHNDDIPFIIRIFRHITGVGVEG